MKKKHIAFLGNLYTCLLLFVIAGCQDSGVHSFKLFSFPPGSAPHEKNWDYFGSINMYEPHNGETLRIIIRVEDNADETLLLDEFSLQLPQNTVDACTKWNNFDTLMVMFSECTNSFCCDDSGAVHFEERLYLYDSLKVQFILQ